MLTSISLPWMSEISISDLVNKSRPEFFASTLSIFNPPIPPNGRDMFSQANKLNLILYGICYCLNTLTQSFSVIFDKKYLSKEFFQFESFLIKSINN